GPLSTLSSGVLVEVVVPTGRREPPCSADGQPGSRVRPQLGETGTPRRSPRTDGDSATARTGESRTAARPPTASWTTRALDGQQKSCRLDVDPTSGCPLER